MILRHFSFKNVLSALFISLAGCTHSDATGIEAPAERQETSTEESRTLPSFPSAPASANVYDRLTPHRWDAQSRYVLYDDGTFELQYVTPRWGFFHYDGAHTRSDSTITFDFDGWSTAGPWEATAVLDGPRLEVEYNVVMYLSDFEDGVYVLTSTD